MSRLDEIQQRLDNATPGPWSGTLEYPEDDALLIRGADASWVGSVSYDGGDAPDAELIAHAPTDLAALVAVVRAVGEIHEARAEGTWEGYCRPCGKEWPCPTAQALDGLEIEPSDANVPGALDRVTDLFEKWAAEENEHRVAGEYGLAEGLRVAIDDLRTAVHGSP